MAAGETATVFWEITLSMADGMCRSILWKYSVRHCGFMRCVFVLISFDVTSFGTFKGVGAVEPLVIARVRRPMMLGGEAAVILRYL
ncbi:MAG: hypothetical protein QG622_2701 [Actinomycetota bacterium]|nr:hypothetical protein [Actinomycetota bacterium]